MPPEKMASQIAHAVKNLGPTPTDADIVVLGVSTKKFGELVKEHNCSIQVDKGLTIVKAGTKTAAAWVDQTEIERLTYEEVVREVGSDGLWEDAIFEYEGEEYRFLYDAYKECVEEYGINDIQEISGNFSQMLGNGLYEKCK